MLQSNKEKFSPLVSIIIPVYNGSNYLKYAIDSALAQTYKNIEIIVINDGSTDDTEKIAKSFGDKIRFFAKGNGGVASALNVGLREMKGDYFSWLSHDDAYYPEKIEKQIDYYLKLENKDVVLYSDFEYMDEESRVTGKMVLDHEMLTSKPEYSLLRSAINGITLLIPVKAFYDYGFFDEKLKCTQDYKKWSEMMKTYNFIHLPIVLAKYRIHGMQDTCKNPAVAIEGDLLWIRMIQELSVDTMIKLEGSEFIFHIEMAAFLKKISPYKKTIEYCYDKAKSALSTNDLSKLICEYGEFRTKIISLDKKINELENELSYVTSSKFWKLRDMYLEIKCFGKK